MSRTMPMESTPSCDISLTYRLKNIRKRSGRLKVRPIKSKYLPNTVSQLNISIVVCLLNADAKVTKIR